MEAKPKNKKIVFMGNSITQMWSDNSFFFKSNPSFINKGISGQTTPQMLIRFNNDVIKENANTVIILAGINDIAQNTGPIQIKDVADNIFRMAEMAQKNNINVFIILVTNYFVNLPPKHFGVRITRNYYNFNIIFFDQEISRNKTKYTSSNGRYCT